MVAQFKRFNPPGLLSEQEIGRLLTYGASRSVPSLPRAPDRTFSDAGSPHTAAQSGSSRPPHLPPPPPSGHSDPSAPGPSGRGAGAGFTQYAIKSSSSSDEEHVLYVDDVSDDASSATHADEIGLTGYVALLKGHSPMVTKMAEEDEWKREVARRKRMDAWFEGMLSA